MRKHFTLNAIPLILAALMAVGIMVIGCFYLVSPERISGTFGPKPPASDADTRAWLLPKGIRDVVAGLVVLTMMLTADGRSVGIALLVEGIIPLGDKSIILGSGGSKSRALSNSVSQAIVARQHGCQRGRARPAKEIRRCERIGGLRAFESIIRADATFRMPPDFGTAAGREAMFKLWVEEGFGSERFGRLHCVVTQANLQPAVAAYVYRPGDSTRRALALDVLRIEDGLITETVVFPPDSFPLFGLPILMDPAPEMNKCH